MSLNAEFDGAVVVDVVEFIVYWAKLLFDGYGVEFVCWGEFYKSYYTLHLLQQFRVVTLFSDWRKNIREKCYNEGQ